MALWMNGKSSACRCQLAESGRLGIRIPQGPLQVDCSRPEHGFLPVAPAIARFLLFFGLLLARLCLGRGFPALLFEEPLVILYLQRNIFRIREQPSQFLFRQEPVRAMVFVSIRVN